MNGHHHSGHHHSGHHHNGHHKKEEGNGKYIAGIVISILEVKLTM